jgi:hypothetical protein
MNPARLHLSVRSRAIVVLTGMAGLAAPLLVGLAPGAAAAGAQGKFESSGGHVKAISHANRPADVEPADLVVDGDGTRHVVTTDRRSATDTRIVYWTRKAGQRHWTRSVVPGKRTTGADSHIAVDALLSDDGKSVFTVLYQCDGVYVGSAPLQSKRLPVPSVAHAEANAKNCPYQGTGIGLNAHTPLHHAVALPGGALAFLAVDRDTGAYRMYSGVPGGSFAAGPPLPSTDEIFPVLVSRESQSGRIVVAGVVEDGLGVTTYDPGTESWSTPVGLAAVETASGKRNVLAGIASGPDTTYVGVTHRGGHSVIVSSTASGWSAPARVPHTGKRDRDMTLAYAPDSGRLYAAWTHRPRGHGRDGAEQASMLDGDWRRPHWLSKSGRDIASALGFAPSGKVVALLARVSPRK